MIEQKVDLPRLAIVLETEEESGSKDLIPLLDACHEWIKDPDYCICLDSGALNYDNIWLTTTLRGVIAFSMKVSIVENAVHSGTSGGIIPETFRIANSLLDRLEDTETRRLPGFEIEIPESYRKEAEDIAALTGEDLINEFKFLEGCKAINYDNLPEIILNSTWRPSLAITGATNMPDVSTAGNVVRSHTVLKVSIRLPPGLKSQEALAKAIKILTEDPPNGAKVEILDASGGDGWRMKDLSERTKSVLEESSKSLYDKGCGYYGMGGSIPFLKVLGDKYPSTEIMALGVLGPETNAHAPNETLDLPYTKKLIGSISHLLAGLA